MRCIIFTHSYTRARVHVASAKASRDRGRLSTRWYDGGQCSNEFEPNEALSFFPYSHIALKTRVYTLTFHHLATYIVGYSLGILLEWWRLHGDEAK